MAYNKRTWATGNVVGAVDLNRMEGGIEENYPGYEYREEIVTLWEGSVTTEGEEEEAYTTFPYTEQIVADKLCVTFNGTTYVCEKIVNGEDIIYGGYVDGNRDFSKYPFTIFSGIDSSDVYNEIDTETAGTYALKIEADNSTITTNKGFQKAVKSVGDSGYECTTSLGEAFSESGATEAQKETTAPCMILLSYTGFINADEIKVVFNDTEYTCPKQAIGGDAIYGATDSSFADYPFSLSFSKSHGNRIFTKDPVDFDITVFAPVMTATVTPCFETAVKTLIPPEYGSETISIPTNSFLQIKSFSVSGNAGYINIPAKDINSTSITVPTGSVSQDLTVVSAAINGVSISSSSAAHLPIIIRSFEYHTDDRCGYVTINLYNTSEEAITINSSEISIHGVVLYYDSNSITTICYRKGLENSTPVYR